MLDLVRPGLERAWRVAEARERLVRAAANPQSGTAVVLLDSYGEIEHSSVDAALRFSPAILDCYVQGLFDTVGRCGRDHSRSLAPSTT